MAMLIIIRLEFQSIDLNLTIKKTFSLKKDKKLEHDPLLLN